MSVSTDYGFWQRFFAPRGRFQPCGMFTYSHIISVVISLLCVILSLFLAQNKKTSNCYFRLTAIILTVLESVKIAHSFIYGDLYIDAWFPLSYCGLFIFALWMTAFGTGKIKRTAEVFIAYGCPVAGVIFLAFPTTSLMMFPIFHYFSLYSLFFHSLMIYSGVFLLKKETEFSKEDFCKYSVFVISFSVLAFILNHFFDGNLMNLREPFNVPIAFFQKLYKTIPYVYSLVVIAVFMAIPFITATMSGKLKRNKMQKTR